MPNGKGLTTTGKVMEELKPKEPVVETGKDNESPPGESELKSKIKEEIGEDPKSEENSDSEHELWKVSNSPNGSPQRNKKRPRHDNSSDDDSEKERELWLVPSALLSMPTNSAN